jgi:hypothetical protein
VICDPFFQQNFYQGLRDMCDAFSRCDTFVVCHAGAASVSFCGCTRGFSLTSPAGWRMRVKVLCLVLVISDNA